MLKIKLAVLSMGSTRKPSRQKYIHPALPPPSYSARFRQWLYSNNLIPYNSYCKGAAKRVSSCAYVATSLEEACDCSKKVIEVTHNNPEEIKGA